MSLGTLVRSAPDNRLLIKLARKKREVHFAEVMALCHQKHSERTDLEPQYKGRVVLRGDKGKFEISEFAMLSEMGTSASQLSAAKALDAIARIPGNRGQNSDAVHAYRQVEGHCGKA